MTDNINSIPVVEQQVSQKIQQSNVKLIKSDYPSLLKYTTPCDFQKNEIEQLLKLFKKSDQNKQGYLGYHDMIELLQEFGFQIDQQCKEQIFKEIEIRNTQKLDFQAILYVARVCKDAEKIVKKDDHQILFNEFIDAFVALGGDPDASGYIYKNQIISILKDEFDLQFGIDEFLEQLEVQDDKLDFDTFRSLFKGNNRRSMERNSSLLSLFSHKSTLKSSSSISTVKIRMKDFEKFLQKMDHDESEYVSQASPMKKQ